MKMNIIFTIRNKIIGLVYRLVLKPIFFLFDPEDVHDFVSLTGKIFGTNFATKGLTAIFFGYKNSILEQEICGIKFINPIGLSAGFDKDAQLMNILPSVGFGFEEIGSFTALPYNGNARPRLYRLPEKQALRVNYGLKNLGAEVLSKKLANQTWQFPVGISIAKTNNPSTSVIENGINDYFTTYLAFQKIGDYFTINISCPNTCEEKPIFAIPENLDLLLAKIFSVPKVKPVFVKLSPDLPDQQLNQILTVCNKYPVDGFVCTNLTKVNVFNHQGKGGFSGKAVEQLSNELISKVYKFYGGKKIIIGCGGVFSAEDAYKKIKLGASLIQLITGMIFMGPQVIAEINMGLVELLKKDGYRNIGEVVGGGRDK
jgi:dihydroorotate dehydrogenase